MLSKSTGLRSENYGNFVFIAIGTLTFLYTFMKAIYLSVVLAGDLVGLICSYLQCLTATVTILLKIYTALISKNKYRFLCISVMIAHIVLDLAITAFAVHKGTESLITATYGTVGSFMDVTAYSLYLRLKVEKLE
ncbi:unnamed protein product [Cylicocyclus nassatus]|uniref:Uncharacterized protein n=1 Tax=Cylicocyclus nassatus TaxID=53992 RepID=A0AA36GS07_CYLNA|nr:unnamed protein product [Cylicocyclus nassatus]